MMKDVDKIRKLEFLNKKLEDKVEDQVAYIEEQRIDIEQKDKLIVAHEQHKKKLDTQMAVQTGMIEAYEKQLLPLEKRLTIKN